MSSNAYKIPAPKASLPENRFFFVLPIDGKDTELSVPKFQYLNRTHSRLVMEQGAKRKKLKEEGKPFLLIDEVDEWIELFGAILPEHAAAFQALEDDQVLELSKAWLEATAPDVPEEDVPESGASSDS